MDMQHEPIRLPALVVALATPLCVLAAAFAAKYGQPELAAFILAIPPAIGIQAVAESKRARTDSPATTEAMIERGQNELIGHVVTPDS